jgi:methyl-accepting chemotaxis protein
MDSRRYALAGAAAGIGLPLVATFIEAGMRFGGVSAASLLAAQVRSPLLWIIDTTPVVTGFLAVLIGRRQETIAALESSREEGFLETADDLSAAARALLTTVHSFRSMTAESAAAVKQTTSTMSGLSHTAMQAALAAETVIGLAQKSRRSSEEGLQAAEATSAGMAKVAEEVRSLEGRIEALNARMRDVFAITGVVGEIAERSGKLAELAERVQAEAGPSADGVAAVAHELRQHATDAGNAAGQVQSILAEAHRAMLAALTAVETGSREAASGAQLAQSAGETIRRLAATIRDSSEGARRIATVALDQDKGFDEVLKAMNEIFHAVEEGVAATRKVDSEAQALGELAEGLKRQVRQASGAARPPSGAPVRRSQA